MGEHRESIERIHELVELRLRQQQLRYTPGRQRVVDVLYHRGGPVGIADIERDAPDLPRSSTYRHLVDLQSVGAVRSLVATDEFTHFELAEDLTEHHHHVLCLTCGAIADVSPPAAFESTITAMIDELARTSGFVPVSHTLDIAGYCHQCGAPATPSARH